MRTRTFILAAWAEKLNCWCVWGNKMINFITFNDTLNNVNYIKPQLQWNVIDNTIKIFNNKKQIKLNFFAHIHSFWNLSPEFWYLITCGRFRQVKWKQMIVMIEGKQHLQSFTKMFEVQSSTTAWANSPTISSLIYVYTQT